jgi:UDP-N-acetylglucosamine acyltransferase
MRAYRLFFMSQRNVGPAIARARAELELIPEVERFVAFFEATERGVSL